MTQSSGSSIAPTSHQEPWVEERSNMLFICNPRLVIANLFDRQLGNDGISPLTTETKQE